MSLRHFLLLLTLGATWGLAFMFMRIAAPEFGAVPLAAARIGSGALVMLAVVAALRQSLRLRSHWKTYLALGAINTAIPFVGYCFAALHIPTGYSAITNATTPVWSALIACLWFKETLSPLKWLGIGFAFAGVVALVGLQPIALTPMVIAAVSATLIGAAMYAAAGFLIRHYLGDVSGFAGATGVVLGAAIWLTLPGLYAAPAAMPSGRAWIAMLLLAVLCTAAAYALFFHLLRRIGPQRAATAAFLFPAFAAFWGWLFLAEPITPNMLLGMGLVFAGTALVTLGGPASGAATQWEKIRDWLLWPLIYTFSPAPLRRRILSRYQRGEHYFREEVNALRRNLPDWLPDADLAQACRDQRLARFVDRADVFMSSLRLRHSLRHHVQQHGLPPGGRPQLLVSAHYGNGWWSLPGLAAQGSPAQMVLAPPPRAANWRQRLWQPYWLLRWREVARLGGAPIIEQRGARKRIEAALQTGGRVIVLLDIPPVALAGAQCSPVPFLGQTAWMPRQSLDIAVRVPGAEIWMFHGELDPVTLKMRLYYRQLDHDGSADEALRQFSETLERLIKNNPGLWHAWGDVRCYFQNGTTTDDAAHHKTR